MRSLWKFNLKAGELPTTQTFPCCLCITTSLSVILCNFPGFICLKYCMKLLHTSFLPVWCKVVSFINYHNSIAFGFFTVLIFWTVHFFTLQCFWQLVSVVYMMKGERVNYILHWYFIWYVSNSNCLSISWLQCFGREWRVIWWTNVYSSVFDTWFFYYIKHNRTHLCY